MRSPTSSHLDTRPNIIYLHSHDTGRFVQPYGYAVPTPNLQLLADQGVVFREAFCVAPTCSGSRASLLTGEYCHQNGMLGLAHRGWSLNDYGHHWVHALRRAGYESTMIGEQHISAEPGVIGYDRVIEVDSHHAYDIAPTTVEALHAAPRDRPWFMSVGFFETHRSFRAPTSVHDTLYSLPPGNLPDTPETRHDVAAFKASARSFDQGVGAVLQGLHETGQADSTLLICTTDHGIAFPNAKATLYDRGIGVMMLMRGPGGFSGGRLFDAMVTHLDVYPTLCELAGIEAPAWCEGTSLLPLVRGERRRLHDEIFAEVTFHVAYEPQRAVRSERWKYIRRFDEHPYPCLANCDDSATKSLLVERGWGRRKVPRERLFDLTFDPNENHNLAGEPECREVLDQMRASLTDWMESTDDPLRHGPIAPPAGALVHAPEQISPEEEPLVSAG